MVKQLPLIILFILTFISIIPLLKSGLPPTHDGEYHVIRFYEFYKTLADGSFYPRWAPDLNYGFGIPLFNFVYPLPNYIASLFHFLGFSFIDSFKLNMVLASFTGAIFMYLWSKEFFGKLGGLLSSTLYTYSPYHFLDIYIRGSVGEVWALGLFPAFLWSITKYIKDKDKKFAILSSIFFALIIFSHNILALMFFPLAISYLSVLISNEKRKGYLILNSIYLILLSLGLSSLFWLPALLERGFVRGLEVFDYSFHFPQFYELIIPSWGSGFSGGSLQNSLSFQIGIANILSLIISMALILMKRKLKELFRINLFFLLWLFLVVFFMLSISLPVWQNLPLINYFQFPWRFLSLAILIISFIAGNIIYAWKVRFIVVVLISLSFSLGIGYAGFAYYHNRDDAYYFKRSNFIDGTNSPGNAFSTIWFGGISKRVENKLSIPKEEIIKEDVKKSEYKFAVNLSEDRVITVNTAYFPGWTVYLDGNKSMTSVTDQGTFSFNAKRGEHSIKVKFEDTPIRKMASVLFLASVLFVLFKLPFFATIKR